MKLAAARRRALKFNHPARQNDGSLTDASCYGMIAFSNQCFGFFWKQEETA